MARARNLTARPERRRAYTVRLAFGLALLGAPSSADAQSRQRARPRVQPEGRADFIRARGTAAHLRVGFSVPAGTYVRFGVVGAVGQTWRDGEPEASGRADVLVRFVPDPLREFRWAPYVAGGLSTMYDETEDWRALLAGALGVEGPALGSMVPAIEVGFGGGTRIGVALRRAMPGRR